MSLFTRTRLLVVPLAAALVFGGAAPALADELSEKRREAEEITDQLESLRVNASMLDEQYNQVALDLVTIEGEVSQAEADVARFEAELTSMRTQATGMAITTYMNPDVTGPLTGMLGGSAAGNEAAQRQGYTSVVLGVSTSLTDQLKATTDDAQVARTVLADKRDRQSELQEELAQNRIAVNSAITEHESLQQSVQGELAQLVAEEQARREAAEAAAARQREQAEAEARQREQAEAAAAETARRDNEARASSAAAASPSNREDDEDDPAPAPAPAVASSGGGGGGGGQQSQPQRPAPQPQPQEEPQAAAEEASGSRGSGANVPSPSPGASGAVAAAMSQLGVGYRFATAIPGQAFDCSGLTKWAWSQAGVSLPHSSKQQYASLPHVPSDQARPGDLFFFGSPIHHVGMYIGDGQMVNATQSGRPVSISNAYRKDLVGVARP